MIAMLAVTIIAQEYRSYIVPLQGKSPLITLLFCFIQGMQMKQNF